MVVGEGLWSRVADWLTLASGLETLIVDTGWFDGAVYMCKGAAEEEFQRSQRLMALATELTRLTYVVYALESAHAVLRPPKLTNRPGKFSAVAGYLASHWVDRPVPDHYDCVLRGLRRSVLGDQEAALNPDPDLEEVSKVLSRHPDNSSLELGVLVVAEMRNYLAHGDISLPGGYVEGDGYRRTAQAQFTTRAGLFALQMLLGAHFAEDDTLLYNDDGEECPVADVIASVSQDVNY